MVEKSGWRMGVGHPSGQTGRVGMRRQLGDSWTIVTAALLGGLGGAVTAALAPGALVGLTVGVSIMAVVYLVKISLDALTNRSPASAGTAGAARLPEPPRGSAAERWLRRAEAALLVLKQQTQAAPDAVLGAQIEDVDDQAAGVVADLRRLAGQVTVVEQALAGIDAGRLSQRAAQLRHEAATSTGALHDEKQRAARAAEDQVRVFERLGEVRRTQLARMESAVLGLEGLAARLAEVLALRLTSSGAGEITASRIAELTGDLDGLRFGLAETSELSRTLLAQTVDSGGSGVVR
jgi:hypothetical protein